MTEKETETTSTKEDTSLAFAGEASSSRLEGEEVEFALCSSSEDAPEGGKSPREIVYHISRMYTQILMIVFPQHINIEEYAMKKHFNSRSALDAIQNTWALRDHEIAIILSPVIL